MAKEYANYSMSPVTRLHEVNSLQHVSTPVKGYGSDVIDTSESQSLHKLPIQEIPYMAMAFTVYLEPLDEEFTVTLPC